nr:radical SAM/SPASM domain-containing protein [Desulfovibrio sp. JC010]
MKIKGKSARSIPSNARIAIYGAGQLGFMLMEYLQQNWRNNTIPFFIDSYKTGEAYGFPVIHVDELFQNKERFDLVVIASEYCHDIAATLQQMGFDNFILLDNENFLFRDISSRSFSNYNRYLLEHKKYLPDMMMMQITSRCNFKCRMCAHESWGNDLGDMDDDLAIRILEECRDHNVSNIHFYASQGEPLLHKNIIKYVKIANDLGLTSTIVTNGSLLNENKIKELFDSGLNKLGLSFAGYDKNSYESVYFGGKFEHIVKCIQLAKTEVAARDRSQQMCVSGTLNSSDSEYHNKTLEFLRNLSLSECEIELKQPANWRGSLKSGVYYPLRDIYSQLPIDDSEVLFCPLVKRWGVFVDGDIAPCGCMNFEKVYTLGNIMNTGLLEMADSESYRMVVESLLSGDLSGNKLCAKCDFPYKLV